MLLVKEINQFNNEHVFFSDPIKNNIINEADFTRILYSDDKMILNGVYLLINLNDISCEKYYNKYKCNFNINSHRDLIERIKTIEESILNKYKTHKIPSYKIYDQLKSGYIKIFCDINNSSSSFILKISGIWLTETNYGLTYKFIKI